MPPALADLSLRLIRAIFPGLRDLGARDAHRWRAIRARQGWTAHIPFPYLCAEGRAIGRWSVLPEVLQDVKVAEDAIFLDDTRLTHWLKAQPLRRLIFARPTGLEAAMQLVRDRSSKTPALRRTLLLAAARGTPAASLLAKGMPGAWLKP